MKYYSLLPLAYLVIGMTFLLPQSSYAGQETFDLRKLGPIQDNHSIPIAERIAQGVKYLKDELANPSKPEWGLAGGPIDTGYIQAVMTGVLQFPGAESPRILRRFRDQETNPLLKDRLTIALANTGAQDTVVDLLRIAREDPVPYIRRDAVAALFTMRQAPKPTDVPLRLRPGEKWHPLDAKVQQAFIEVLLLHLQDTYKHYNGSRQDEHFAYHVLATSARNYLRVMGYSAEPTSVGWRVADENGRIVRIIRTKEKPLLPQPTPLP